MGEGEKFIRHILPGLVFLIFLGIQLSSFMMNDIIIYYSEASTEHIILAVFILGGIGYLFSNIYFVVTYWFDYTVSHHDFVRNLVKDNKISLEPSLAINDITQEKAWAIINTIWYVTLKKNKMERVTVPISRLSHLLHGMGISFVALAMSIVISFAFYLVYGCDCSILCYAFTLFLSLVFLYLFGYNYVITKRKYYSFVNSAVLTSIHELKRSRNSKGKGNTDEELKNAPPLDKSEGETLTKNEDETIKIFFSE